jgi:murein DD-endopeptidase MepM/ murein hydrolase activator NlpD
MFQRLMVQPPLPAAPLAIESRGGVRRVSLSMGAAAIAITAFVALAATSASVIGFVAMREEALLALDYTRSRGEAAFQARLQEARMELARAQSQRAMERSLLERKVSELAARQRELESRAAKLDAMAREAGLAIGEAGAQATTQRRAGRPAPSTPARSGDVTGVIEKKPSPEAALQPALRGALAPAMEIGGARPGEPRPFYGAVLASLDRLDALQTAAAAAIAARAGDEARRLQAKFGELGLRPERFDAPQSGVGGPYIPVKEPPPGARPFDLEVFRHQQQIARADRLRRALGAAPLGRPVSGSAEMTSGFGPRIDPFLGRPAQHSGVDFRDARGGPVYATGAGIVAFAGWSGGYGLMVEIDHGHGITTRYAHLSAILTTPGAKVAAGRHIGRIGSTGRSTGPHLHYEVRVDDDAVDPARYLRVGARLAGL